MLQPFQWWWFWARGDKVLVLLTGEEEARGAPGVSISSGRRMS